MTCALAALSVTAAAGAAQGDSGRGTWLDVGVRTGHLTVRDEVITPLRYSGLGIVQMGASLRHESPRTRHGLSFWFGERGVSAERSLASDQTISTTGVASYSFLKRISDDPWWVGGTAAVRVQHTEYELRAGSADGFFYAAGVDMKGGRDVALGPRTVLRMSAGIPIVVWAARPPWSAVDEARLQSDNDFAHRFGEGEIAWIGTLKAIRMRADVHHRLSEHVGVWIAGRADYERLSRSQRYASGVLGVDAGVSIGWGAS